VETVPKKKYESEGSTTLPGEREVSQSHNPDLALVKEWKSGGGGEGSKNEEYATNGRAKSGPAGN